MCRLLGAVHYGRPTSLSDLEVALKFDHLSGFHNDGRGSCVVTSDGRIETVRDPQGEDGSYWRTLTEPMLAGIWHLRLATMGAVTSVNTHPFSQILPGSGHPVTLMHNGTLDRAWLVQQVERLSVDEPPARHGNTDTEVYLQYLMASLPGRVLSATHVRDLRTFDVEVDVLDAIATAVAAIGRHSPRRSYNALLMTPWGVVVLASDAPTLSSERLQLMGGGRQIPPEHEENYYGIKFVDTGSSVIVSSTGMPQVRGQWLTVPPGTLLLIRWDGTRLSRHISDGVDQARHMCDSDRGAIPTPRFGVPVSSSGR